MDSNHENLIQFNFIRFIKFLQKNNIFAVAIAAILSDQIHSITNGFVDSIILPIIDRDGNNDNIKDIKK